MPSTAKKLVAPWAPKKPALKLPRPHNLHELIRGGLLFFEPEPRFTNLRTGTGNTPEQRMNY